MRTVRLGDIVKIRTGKLNANAQIEDGHYPFFTCARDISRIDTYSFDCECVLIAGNGELNVKYYSGKFDAYQRVYVIEAVDRTEINTRFLYYFLESYIEKLRAGAIGGVIKYIKLAHLTEIDFPLFDISTQREMVAALDKAKGLIDLRLQSVEMLDQLLSDTFLSMFGDLANNEKGFDVVNLSEVTSHIKDGPHVSPKYSETGYPILSTRNIRPFELIETDYKYVDETTYLELVSRFKPEKGDVLLTKGGTTGYAKEVDFDFDFCVWVHLAVLRPKKELINPTYLESALNSKNVYLQSQYYTRGIANKDLGLKRIAKIEILLPPLPLQEKYARFARKTFAQKSRLVDNRVLQETLFQSLLQRAFHGDLTIGPDLQLDGYLENENFMAIAADAVLIQTLIDRFNQAKTDALGEVLEQESEPFRFETKAAYNSAKDALFHLLKEGLVTQKTPENEEEPFKTYLATS